MKAFNSTGILQATKIGHVEYHPVLESTNLLASELAADLLPRAPALVITDRQTAGRGRGTNAWWASAGALTFSLVLDVETLALSAESLPLVSLVAGLAVRDVVAKLVQNRSVAIKWPNDVMIGEHKVSGILTEQKPVGSSAVIIVGIGINLNNSLAEAPTDIRQRATSVFDVTGATTDLQETLIDLLLTFDHIHSLLVDKPTEVIRQVNTHNLLHHRQITLSAANTRHHGICLGVRHDGALLVDTELGPTAFVAATILDWK